MTMQAVTNDTLLGGRVRLRQPAKGYRVAIDPVLLAAFVRVEAGDTACEFGCGTGAALLCLAARVPGLRLTGLERAPELRELARHNVLQGEIIAGEIGGAWVLPERAFDHVLFNPPFFPESSYSASPHETRSEAHRLTTPLKEWLHAARRALKADGQVSFIIHHGQLEEAITGLATGFGAAEIKPVRPKAGANASRLLIRAQMGRKTPPAVLPDLILHESDGSYTQAAQQILAEAGAL